jgi:hypothetical protein
VRRIATQAIGLSPEAQEEVLAHIDELRRKEHLSA